MNDVEILYVIDSKRQWSQRVGNRVQRLNSSETEHAIERSLWLYRHILQD
jgi:hypothetical protein